MCWRWPRPREGQRTPSRAHGPGGGSRLPTEDKDFGWYVYAAGEGGLGVVLIRFPAGARSLGNAVVEAVRSLGERLLRSFTVVEPGRVRVSPTPSGENRS